MSRVVTLISLIISLILRSLKKESLQIFAQVEWRIEFYFSNIGHLSRMTNNIVALYLFRRDVDFGSPRLEIGIDRKTTVALDRRDEESRRRCRKDCQKNDNAYFHKSVT